MASRGRKPAHRLRRYRFLTLALFTAVITLLFAALSTSAIAQDAPAPGLSPSHGAVGTRFQVNLSNDFDSCDGPVSITAGGEVQPIEGYDGLSLTVSVRSGVAPGDYPIIASCNLPSPSIQDSSPASQASEPPKLKSAPAYFRVDAASSKPVLSLGSTRGAPGDSVDVSGTGFVCTTDSTGSNDVQLTWDGTSLESTTADYSGSFNTQIQVPADATSGDHRVTAGCAYASDLSDTKTFTIDTGQGGSNGNPNGDNPGGNGGGGDNPGGNGGGGDNPGGDNPGGGGSVGDQGDSGGGTSQPAAWVIGSASGGGVLLLALGAAFLLLRHRAPRWVRTHVRATLRPDGPGEATLQETPAPGRPTAGIRLEARPDPGTQTIQETES